MFYNVRINYQLCFIGRFFDKYFVYSPFLDDSSCSVFVRIDLYSVKEKIYFGEFTFYPNAGFDTNRLPEIDKMFGDMVDLRGIKNE